MISDYASLQTAISDYLARSDLTTANLQTFIGLAESRIYRELRVRQMEKTASPTVTNASFPVPSDYVQMKSLYVTNNTGAYLYEIERVTPFWLRSNFQIQSSQGQPSYYAREGSNFILGPYPDGTYPVTMLYFAKLLSLSDSNTTNWLTDDHPDLIFAASMVEAATFIQDAEALAYWESKYASISNSVQSMDRRESISGSPGVTRPG